jgi:Transcription factor WhiB
MGRLYTVKRHPAQASVTLPEFELEWLDVITEVTPPCANILATGVDYWFEDLHGGRIPKVKNICLNECPIQRECLAYVLALPEHPAYGIWAGYGVNEIIAMRQAAQKEKRL